MIAVIPYRYDRDHGNELKFAIRSLVKYFKSLSEIIIVGDAPDWYTGQHIYLPDVDKRKEYSIYSKLVQVQSTVCYSNDDYFALQPFDVDLRNYYRGLCRNTRPADKVYRELYGNCPGEWMDFDVHTPMIIDTTKFEWGIDRPIKTYYANQNKLKGTHLVDCKLRGTKTYDEIKYSIANRPFFSIDGNSKIGGMPEILNELYPDKSKYEL